ncbi:Hint domain-containing protein [Paracoccus albus]|uniref:Hint domain-containing protein n=1 Tax=Paracoccus albus TaxID=3017784 RepID=UPI0022F053C5|nr:Hint domain-containing protein [Paracoccus albus]WBU59496.1 Hint domain-containing protein [Paracoccus albus]
MAQEVTWYLTDVTRAHGNDPWTVQGTSTEVLVWFGEQSEWDALPSTEQDQYDIYIIDEPGGDKLVDADELREAMARYDGTYQFPDNSGYLGTDQIDEDGNPSTPDSASVGLAVDGSGIESSKKAVIISLEPITAETIDGGYKGGKGNFDPFLPGKLTPPCFVRGTMIRTPDGAKPVETLKTGDLVMTADNGPQPILMIISARIGPERLTTQPNLRPVRIKAGALGNDLPKTDLLVSQQHRVLVRSKITRRMFGADEILVAAKHLIQVAGIEIAWDVDEAEYFHILFARHEIIYANDASVESLYTGQEAINGLGEAALTELQQIFPEIFEGGEPFEPARIFVNGSHGRTLARRHNVNHQPLLL